MRGDSSRFVCQGIPAKGVSMNHYNQRRVQSCAGSPRAPGVSDQSRHGLLRSMAVVILILGCHAAWAQRDTSSLLGTVRDLPGARVTATGISEGAATDSSGDYVVTPLRVGTYRMRAEAKGMAPQVLEGVIPNVDQHLRVDFFLAGWISPGTGHRNGSAADAASPHKSP